RPARRAGCWRSSAGRRRAPRARPSRPAPAATASLRPPGGRPGWRRPTPPRWPRLRFESSSSLLLAKRLLEVGLGRPERREGPVEFGVRRARRGLRLEKVLDERGVLLVAERHDPQLLGRGVAAEPLRFQEEPRLVQLAERARHLEPGQALGLLRLPLRLLALDRLLPARRALSAPV